MTEPAGAAGTLTVAAVEALDLSALRPAAYAVEHGGDVLQTTSTAVDDSIRRALQTWAGAAAEAAGAATRDATAEASAAARRAAELGQAMRDAFSQMTTARTRLLDITSDLNAQGLRIDADTAQVRAAGAEPADEHKALRGTVLLRRALREFGVVDADMAAAVASAADPAVTDAFGAAIGGPFAGFYGRAQAMADLPSTPRDAAPSVNREFWEALTADERAQLIEVRPAAVGGMDGIPVDARHRANTALLDVEEDRLQADRTRLTQEYARSPSRFVYGLGSGTDERLTRVNAKLDDIAAVRRITAKNPAARLMLLDMKSGEHGKAVIAVGDPDTADHISVTVPGDNTTVRGSMAGMIEEATALRDDAATQTAAPPDGPTSAGAHPTAAAAPFRGGSVASIAWIGYHAPDWPDDPTEISSLVDMVTDDRARDGAAHLAPFLDGLQVASENADPHITALGHSYGSLTASLALQDPAEHGVVDDAVFYGSPGLEADSAAGLGLSDHHAFVLEADGDMIADTGVLGSDPGDSDGFEHLSTDRAVTDDGLARSGAHGHSEYARPDDDGVPRTSAHNMAAVVSGRLDHAVSE